MSHEQKNYVKQELEYDVDQNVVYVNTFCYLYLHVLWTKQSHPAV